MTSVYNRRIYIVELRPLSNASALSFFITTLISQMSYWWSAQILCTFVTLMTLDNTCLILVDSPQFFGGQKSPKFHTWPSSNNSALPNKELHRKSKIQFFEDPIFREQKSPRDHHVGMHTIISSPFCTTVKANSHTHSLRFVLAGLFSNIRMG